MLQDGGRRVGGAAAVQAQPTCELTPEEYLRVERQAETKSEYWHGQVYALAGASEEHNLIVANLVMVLGPQFKGRPCKVYANDMRVKVRATGLYTYPDVIVVCGKAAFEDRRRDTLLNPTVIIEVLSPSTEAYDRGTKFEHYRDLESLSDYLLVAQESPTIEHFERLPENKWLLSTYKGLDAVAPIVYAACDLPLREVYDKVEWPDQETAAGLLRVVKEPDADYG
jgi:Uma2 family endonuclease